MNRNSTLFLLLLFGKLCVIRALVILRTILPISWQVLSSRAVIEDSFTDFKARFVLKSEYIDTNFSLYNKYFHLILNLYFILSILLLINLNPLYDTKNGIRQFVCHSCVNLTSCTL